MNKKSTTESRRSLLKKAGAVTLGTGVAGSVLTGAAGTAAAVQTYIKDEKGGWSTQDWSNWYGYTPTDTTERAFSSSIGVSNPIDSAGDEVVYYVDVNLNGATMWVDDSFNIVEPASEITGHDITITYDESELLNVDAPGRDGWVGGHAAEVNDDGPVDVLLDESTVPGATFDYGVDLLEETFGTGYSVTKSTMDYVADIADLSTTTEKINDVFSYHLIYDQVGYFNGVGEVNSFRKFRVDMYEWETATIDFDVETDLHNYDDPYYTDFTHSITLDP